MDRLTPKQRRFVEEYLVDLNGTQAAIGAGYSKRTAQEQSSRLLSNVMVRRVIDAATEALSERTEVTVERVVNELSFVAFEGEHKTSDKLKALELLGRHLGMFKDKVEVEGKVPGGISAEPMSPEEWIRRYGRSEGVASAAGAAEVAPAATDGAMN